MKRVDFRTEQGCNAAGCIAVVWFCTALLAACVVLLVLMREPLARMWRGW